jgi:hypothetical protein
MLIVVMTGRPMAHKPITSPFTFSADVRPILQERCGRCHSPGGIAPMSLLTHSDTVPWGESLRVELMSGHMPPWRVDRGADRVVNPGGLSARELNVLLTWITGGTPAGEPIPDSPAAPMREWPLGPPDAVLPLPTVSLTAEEQERTAEVALSELPDVRTLRAVDLLPGTPALVRSATIEVRGPAVGSGRDERLLNVWVPGDEPVSLAGGHYTLPAGAKVVVRIRYRKTWEYERKEMTDASRVGLYFAPAASRPVQRVALTPTGAVTLTRASTAVAIYPDPELSDSGVVVTATRPDGRREDLIGFQSHRGWSRRYWFREPVALPGGTRLTVRVTPEPPSLLSSAFRPPPRRPPSPARVFVNLL